MGPDSMQVGLESLRAAQERIAGVVHRTPIATSSLLDARFDAALFFKCENRQKAGAFKFRGAANAVASLPEDARRRGVATHSSGNHGAALARAAKQYEIPCHVVMPENSMAVKKTAVAAYGGTITYCEPTLAAREETLAQVLANTGATFVHPYDNFAIINGQGTAGLEICEQLEDFDVLATPVGGGGLLAGAAVAVKSLLPGVTVLGVEPEGADDAARSLRAGQRVRELQPQTIADGLRTTLGVRNFEIIRHWVDDIVLVSDAQIVEAMALIFTRLKEVVEPSAAVPLAGVIAHPERFRGQRVAVVLSGGNVDLGNLPFK